MSTPLQVSVIDAQTFQVAIPGDSVKYKTSLLLQAQEIEHVNNPQELEVARAVAAEIKKAVQDVERVRVELTKPFLDTQRILKAKADEWREGLDCQLQYLESIISDYIYAELEKVAAAKRAAEAEVRKRQEEIACADRIERDRLAELERLRDEELTRCEALKTKAAKEKSLAEVARLRKEQEALELERLERESEPVVTIVAPAPALDTRGLSVRPTYEITVTDVHALYAWNRNFVTLEAKKSLLNTIVNDHNGEIEIPGVAIKKVLKTNVRSAL